METAAILKDVPSKPETLEKVSQKYESMAVDLFRSDSSTASPDTVIQGLLSTLSTSFKKNDIHPILKIAPSVKTKRETIIQEWSGIVLDTSLSEEYFLAKLIDQTDAARPDEEVEILVEEIPYEDRSLIAAGAEFSWYILYEDGYKCRRKRVSKIRFRRLGNWTNAELKIAENKGKELFDFFSTD